MDGRPGTWMGVSNCVMSPAKWSDVASKGAKDTILFTIFVEGTYLKRHCLWKCFNRIFSSWKCYLLRHLLQILCSEKFCWHLYKWCSQTIDKLTSAEHNGRRVTHCLMIHSTSRQIFNNANVFGIQILNWLLINSRMKGRHTTVRGHTWLNIAPTSWCWPQVYSRHGSYLSDK